MIDTFNSPKNSHDKVIFGVHFFKFGKDSVKKLLTKEKT